MGRMARDTQDDASEQTAMLWLLESYDATAVPHGARTGLAAARQLVIEGPEEMASLIDSPAPTLRAVAVLERVRDTADDEPVEELTDDEPPVRLDDVPSFWLAEQRLERRVDCAMAVAAAAESDTAETAVGQAVNISVSGIHVVMDRTAVLGPIELIVNDSVVRARVVSQRDVGDGLYAWHVHVLDADDEWFALVGSLLSTDA